MDVVANWKRVMKYKVKVLSHSTAVHFFSLLVSCQFVERTAFVLLSQSTLLTRFSIFLTPVSREFRKGIDLCTRVSLLYGSKT